MNISTIVCVVDAKTEFNLSGFLTDIPDSDYIKTITPTDFGNQLTIEFILDKKINVKIFSNGKLQFTGLKSNYKEQIDSILKIIYALGKNVIQRKELICDKNELNLFVHKGHSIIGKQDGEYKIIGYIKKNMTNYINGHELVPFDLSRNLITSKSHLNKIKPLFNNYGEIIGELEYIIFSSRLFGRDISETQKQHLFFINKQDELDYIKNGLEMDKKYFLKRNTKNLILKFNRIFKLNDEVYVIYKKYYKNDTIDLNSNMIYGFIKVKLHDNKLFPELSKNDDVSVKSIVINNYLYSNENFKDEYTIKICNINTDFKAHKINEKDQLNLYKIQKEFKSDHSISITYDPSKYSALKINFNNLETSIRIFKSFNCKISTKSFENAKIVENLIRNFINNNYNEITYKFINVNIKEELSLDDFI